jgi:lipopolysaccharide export system protein LptA
VSLGGFGYQKDLPVEITADSLDVNQTDGTAVFDGTVIIGQGDMRLAAAKVVVEYGPGADGKDEIKRLLASGGVTLVSADEQAEAQSAVYAVVEGFVTLSGNVLVTQGATAIAGDQMVVNLSTGDGKVEGNVRTVLNPKKSN